MIKKLRTKFVCITMSIVTIMIMIMLGLVYYFTQSEMELQSINMMNSIALGPYRVNTPVEPDGEIRLPYFTVRLGPDGEQIEAGGSYYDLSNKGLINEIIEKAQDVRHKTGVLKKYNLRYCRIEGSRYVYIVFADITSELATLRGLMRNCLIIGALGFICFLFASILLSRWAVKPVDEAFRQQKRFIADASHELKTPLTVIMTNAQMMQESNDDKLRSQSADNILTMSQQMKKLIEQLLCLARAESGSRNMNFENLNISKLYSNTLLPFEPVFFEKGLVLKCSIEDDINVLGNKEELRRLLEILLDNACKYTLPEGTAAVSLQKKGKSTMQLSVGNESDAIDAEKLDLIFQRFYRADNARIRDGSFGLGLPIARSIAQRHNGKIHAEYENGMIHFIFEMRTI